MDAREFLGGHYLKVEDCPNKMLLKVAEVRAEELGEGRDRKRKPVVYFEGVEKGLALNATNNRAMMDITGTYETNDWVGWVVQVDVDPTVRFGDRQVGGLVVSPAPPQGQLGQQSQDTRPPPGPQGQRW